MKSNRFTRVARRVVGWLLVAIAALGLFGAPRTSTVPVIRCGNPALLIAVDAQAAEVSSARVDECQESARTQVLGALFIIGLPGVVLLLMPRIVRRYRRSSSKGRSFRTQLERSSRPSWLGPSPVEVVLVGPHAPAEAVERLRSLGNGGPPGSLRVRIGRDQTLEARLVAANAPRFFGVVAESQGGSEVRGYVRQARDSQWPNWFMFSFAAVMWIAGISIWATSTPSGSTDLSFLPILGIALFFTVFSVGLRRLEARTFPTSVSRLARSVAAAVDAPRPELPVRARPVRFSRQIVVGLIALQAVVFAARIAVTDGVFVAILATLVFSLVLTIGVVLATRLQPRLDRGELRVALRSVELDRVTEIRARGAFMSLADGHTRVVVSSALGRPETAAEAEETLRVAPTADSRTDKTAHLVLAIAACIARCPLDEGTAKTLHRSPTPGVPPGSPPRFSAVALAPVGALLVAFGATIGLLAVIRGACGC